MENEGKRMYWWAGCKGCGAFQVTSALAFLVDLLDRSPRAVGSDKGFWTRQHRIIASEICQKSTFWNWDSGCLVELHRIQHLQDCPDVPDRLLFDQGKPFDIFWWLACKAFTKSCSDGNEGMASPGFGQREMSPDSPPTKFQARSLPTSAPSLAVIARSCSELLVAIPSLPLCWWIETVSTDSARPIALPLYFAWRMVCRKQPPPTEQFPDASPAVHWTSSTKASLELPLQFAALSAFPPAIRGSCAPLLQSAGKSLSTLWSAGTTSCQGSPAGKTREKGRPARFHDVVQQSSNCLHFTQDIIECGLAMYPWNLWFRSQNQAVASFHAQNHLASAIERRSLAMANSRAVSPRACQQSDWIAGMYCTKQSREM